MFLIDGECGKLCSCCSGCLMLFAVTKLKASEGGVLPIIHHYLLSPAQTRPLGGQYR